MNCMKCGREVGSDQVFCPKCLELMDKHPVKPDVVVQLPQRRDASPKKAQPRKKLLPAEEQIFRLKRRNRWMLAGICLLLVINILLTILCVDSFRQLDVQKLLGKNYSTEETVN